MQNFILCIETAADMDGENAIAAIKLTGVGNPEFLVSEQVKSLYL